MNILQESNFHFTIPEYLQSQGKDWRSLEVFRHLLVRLQPHGGLVLAGVGDPHAALLGAPVFGPIAHVRALLLVRQELCDRHRAFAPLEHARAAGHGQHAVGPNAQLADSGIPVTRQQAVDKTENLRR